MNTEQGINTRYSLKRDLRVRHGPFFCHHSEALMQDDPAPAGDNCPDSYRSSLEADDELHQLYDQAPCGYHSLDDNGVFIRINQTELTMLGYEREAILHKKTFADWLTPDSQQTFAENFPVFKTQGWVRDLAFQIFVKTGHTFPLASVQRWLGMQTKTP